MSGRVASILTDLGYAEASSLEIKEKMPSAKELARTMASFANADGGTIIIGVKEHLDVVGVPEDVPVKSIYQEAFLSLRPHPLMDYRFADVEGKRICIITVQKYPVPILTEEERYYVRKGDASVLMEENLIEGLATVVPEIKSNVLKSFGLEDSESLKDDNLSRFTKIIHDKLEETTSITKLYEILLEPIKRTRDETTIQLNECRWQKRITFIVAFAFLIIALVLVATGIILIFANHLQVGIVNTASSILSGIVSGLAFTFNKQAHDRNDKFYKDMVALEKSYATLQCIPLISDVRMRNETLRDLIKNSFQEI